MLLVGATEPEVGSWLHAAGHATRAVRGADAALAALGEEPADLVIVDREPGDGLDAPGVCVALREDPRLGSSWLLAITTPAHGRRADVGGADDYLHRPFTRVQLLARARTGAARGAAALRRRAAAVADGDGARRGLPLGLARQPPARADHRRDRADLGLSRPTTSSRARGARS